MIASARSENASVPTSRSLLSVAKQSIIEIGPDRASDQAISWRVTRVDFRKRMASQIIPEEFMDTGGIESPCCSESRRRYIRSRRRITTSQWQNTPAQHCHAEAMIRPCPSRRLSTPVTPRDFCPRPHLATAMDAKPWYLPMQKTEPRFHQGRRSGSGQPPIGAPETMATRAAAHPRPSEYRLQAVSGGSRRDGRTAANLFVLPRPVFTRIVAAAAAPLAFAAALWLTAPRSTAPDVVAVLANATVSDSASLMAAVQTAGLRGAADIKGAIEEVKRIDSERVVIRGWASDAASGAPLAIIVFAGKAHVVASTDDFSSGFMRLVGLSGAATTTPFRGTFGCTRGEKLYVVAVTAEGRYSQFRSLACP